MPKGKKKEIETTEEKVTVEAKEEVKENKGDVTELISKLSEEELNLILEKLGKKAPEAPAVVKSPYERQKELDLEKVRGKFLCLEPKGGEVTFSKRKYKEEKVTTYTLQDGKEYTIPRYVAQDLNNTGWDVNSHILDKDGNPTTAVGKKEHRFSFQSLDFI